MATNIISAPSSATSELGANNIAKTATNGESNFSQQLQKAGEKTANTEKTPPANQQQQNSNTPEEKPSTAAAKTEETTLPDANTTAHNENQQTGLPIDSPLLALVNLQIQISGQPTNANPIHANSKAPIAISDEEKKLPTLSDTAENLAAQFIAQQGISNTLTTQSTQNTQNTPVLDKATQVQNNTQLPLNVAKELTHSQNTSSASQFTNTPINPIDTHLDSTSVNILTQNKEASSIINTGIAHATFTEGSTATTIDAITKPDLNNTPTTTPISTPSSINNNLSTTANNEASTIRAPMGTPAWQDGLNQQVIQLHQRGDKNIELHLNPADLGPLSISLKVSDNTAQVQFLSPHPQVRHAVEQALPQLREALAEQGINLGQTSVGGQQQQTRDETPSRTPTNQKGEYLTESELESVTSQTAQQVTPSGRLSLYA